MGNRGDEGTALKGESKEDKEEMTDKKTSKKLDKSYPVPCRKVCKISKKNPWCPLYDRAVDKCPEGWK